MDDIKEAWINENGNIEMTQSLFELILSEIEQMKDSFPQTELLGAVYCCAVTCGPEADDVKKVEIKLPKALAFADCLRRALGGCSVQFDDRGGGCRDDFPG